jgi:hypothetical protein
MTRRALLHGFSAYRRRPGAVRGGAAGSSRPGGGVGHVLDADDGIHVLVDRIVPLDRAAEALDVVPAGHAEGAAGHAEDEVLVEPRPDGTSRRVVPRLTDRREP